MAKNHQNVYGKYREYGDAIKQQQSSLCSMYLFRSLGAMVLIGLFLTAIAFAESPEKTAPSYFVIAYPSSDIATIAQSQEQLQKHFGDRIEGYVDPHQYLVYATSEEIQSLQNDAAILSSVAYTPTTSERLLTEKTAKREVIISLFANADEQQIASHLQELGMEVRDVYPTVITGELDLSSLHNVLALNGIIHVEEKPEYQLFNDKSVIMTGVADVRQRFSLYGTNQLIGILDGGLDTGKIDASMHDDIEGRIVGITDVWSGPVGQSDLGVDYDSHGTHVTGIVLGNGILSGSNPSQKQFANSYAGVAPEAQVDFYSMGGNQGTSSAPPSFLSVMVFSPSSQKGSRLNTNSWGVIGADGKYLFGSQDIDNFMWQNKEYLVVFAAGNNPGPGTVSPPCTNKNGICVSAIERDDINKYVYAQGPTLDGRFGISLRAPGVGYIGQTSGQGIISTKSSMQQAWPIGCQGAGGTYYCEQSGTSMAAPHVAGSAALLREFYQTRQNLPNPTAALIKATMLNGAEPVNGLNAPNNRDGFGRLNMTDTLPSYPGFLAYIDERTGITTSQKKTYTFSAGTNYPFSLTLAWTDKAPTSYSNQSQKKLVNDLNLVITDPLGNQYYGNDITAPYNNQIDSLNNVEQVRIANPVKGKYTVEVKGANIPQGPQDFAFAVTYDNALMKVISRGPATTCALC